MHTSHKEILFSIRSPKAYELVWENATPGGEYPPLTTMANVAEITSDTRGYFPRLSSRLTTIHYGKACPSSDAALRLLYARTEAAYSTKRGSFKNSMKIFNVVIHGAFLIQTEYGYIDAASNQVGTRAEWSLDYFDFL